MSLLDQTSHQFGYDVWINEIVILVISLEDPDYHIIILLELGIYLFLLLDRPIPDYDGFHDLGPVLSKREHIFDPLPLKLIEDLLTLERE